MTINFHNFYFENVKMLNLIVEWRISIEIFVLNVINWFTPISSLAYHNDLCAREDDMLIFVHFTNERTET